MLDLIYPPSTAPLLKGCSRARSSEMLPIVDENGVVYAQAPRQYCHNGTAKPLHPVVHLHIINREGEIYLQRRSAKKDLLPLRWDTAVGGHVSYGEYLLEALYRESYEELKMVSFNPIWLLSYVFESDREKELVNVYAAVGNFTPAPDGDEVLEGRYWSPEQIDQAIGKDILTPNFESEYRRVSNMLQALL